MNKLELCEIRDRLKHYRNVAAEKRELELKLIELDETLGVKAVGYEGIGGKTNAISRTVENQAMKIVETKDKIEKLIQVRGVEITRIENAISVLDPKEKEIIELKHIENHNWDTVGYKAERSSKTCKKIEKQAIAKIYSILNTDIDLC